MPSSPEDSTFQTQRELCKQHILRHQENQARKHQQYYKQEVLGRTSRLISVDITQPV
jgi:hypothetical protein